MKDLLTFMGEHPFLTVIMLYIVVQGTIYIVAAARGSNKDKEL